MNRSAPSDNQKELTPMLNWESIKSEEYLQWLKDKDYVESLKHYQGIINQWEEAARQRVSQQYPKIKVEKIFAVEDAWHDYKRTGNFELIYEELFDDVDELSLKWESKWRKMRFNAQDFRSCLWQQIWKVSSKYNGVIHYYLYETVKNAQHNWCKEFVRNNTNSKQKRFERHTLPLDPNHDDYMDNGFELESNVISKLTVKQVVYGFNHTEQKMIFYKMHYPKITNRELAEILGLKCKVAIWRLWGKVSVRLTNKLQLT